MNMFDTINQRRSIRNFKPDAVPKELVEKILDAATKAPSAMNRQPWRFVVLEGEKKDTLVELFQKRISKLKKLNKNVSFVEMTAKVMKQAPVLILVFNAESRSKGIYKPFTTVMDVLHMQ